jgi:hypothetical protein
MSLKMEWINTYIHGNITRKLPVYVTFISNKLKCHLFHFVLSLFSSTKSENRRAEKVLPSGEGWLQWKRGGDAERSRRQRMFTHVCKCKNDTC